MNKKRSKTKERMQTQVKPNNRTYEKNRIKTINNTEGDEIAAFKK